MTCNNIPKSASFCGIPEPNRRKPYFHKVRGWFRKMLHFSGGRQGQLEQTDAAQSGDADTSMSPLEPLSPTFMEFPSSELLTAKPLPETLVPTTSELPSELLVPTPPDADAESLSPASLRSSAVKQLHVIAADSTDDVAVGSFSSLDTRSSKSTIITSGYNSMERPGGIPRRSNSVSVQCNSTTAIMRRNSMLFQ